MTERRCGNCRWFVGDDLCFRYPKENATGPNSFCGDWQDKDVTPEQEDRRELTRRFAVAIMSAEYAAEPCLQWDRIWAAAQNMAAAEPQIQREEKQ